MFDNTLSNTMDFVYHSTIRASLLAGSSGGGGGGGGSGGPIISHSEA